MSSLKIRAYAGLTLVIVMFCSSGFAEEKASREPAGLRSWTLEKLTVAKEYWWGGVKSAQQLKEDVWGLRDSNLVAEQISSDIQVFFDKAGPFSRRLGFVMTTAEEFFSRNMIKDSHAFWANGEGRKFLNGQAAEVRKFWLEGEGREYLDKAYKEQKSFLNQSPAKQLLENHIKVSAKMINHFWSKGAGAASLLEKTPINQEFWATGPGAKLTQDLVHSDIDMLNRLGKVFLEAKEAALKNDKDSAKK